MQHATFAAGCFWGVEETFRMLEGVIDTRVGYTGGVTENPDYSQVCTGQTGHAEAVQIDFDPNVISYDRLLEVFWEAHDPTQLNRQGPDIGTQYRSAVFYHNDEQKRASVESMKRLEDSGKLSGPVVTEIVPAGPFYKAEEYHQRYFQKRGGGRCHSCFLKGF